MNPYIIQRMAEGYEERQKETDFVAWLHGRYVYMAFATVMSNAFSKNSKAEYPNEPMLLSKSKAELSEDEKQIQRELFMAELQVMMQNFEATHPKSNNIEN